MILNYKKLSITGLLICISIAHFSARAGSPEDTLESIKQLQERIQNLPEEHQASMIKLVNELNGKLKLMETAVAQQKEEKAPKQVTEDTSKKQDKPTKKHRTHNTDYSDNLDDNYYNSNHYTGGRNGGLDSANYGSAGEWREGDQGIYWTGSGPAPGSNSYSHSYENGDWYEGDQGITWHPRW